MVLGSLVAHGAWADSTPPSAGTSFQYTRSVWRVSDGLPEDTVQALGESANGLLWIGTTGGLARFDGSRIQTYDGERARLASVNSVFCLMVSRDGAIWEGTEGGGLLRIDASGVRVYSAAEGLADGFVRSVFEDDRGRLWVGTDGGLFLKNGAGFERWRSGQNAEPLAVHSITEDREHRLWVGGSRLFSIDADGRETVYPLPGAFSQNRVKRIAQTSDGTIWVGTVRGLQRLRNGRFEVVPGISSTVRALLQTADGTLWIGTIGAGLWTLQQGAGGHDLLRRVSRPSLLPSDTVLSILEDDQRQIWVGTQAGLVRLSQTPVSITALPEGGDPDYETISGDTRGSVWIAAQRLYLIRNGAARRVSYGDPSPFAVRNVFRARDGALWIGTDGGGAFHVAEDGKTTHYTAPSRLTNNFIRGFLETHDGTLWVACDEGVTLIRPDGERKLTEADGLAYFSTRSLLEDRDRSIWIGTDRGLSHWVHGAFVEDAATRALAQEKVWTMLQDRTGALWFGTRDHGIFRYEGGTPVQLTTAQGLPSNSIYQLLEDRRGNLWMTGPNTIASVRESGFGEGSPTGSEPLNTTIYEMPFGAEGAQLYGGRQPSGFLAPDDTLWFPTNRGAAHVSAASPLAGPGPRAYQQDIREDGQTVRASGGGIDVPARINRLSFSFSALFLRAQTGLRFWYRLENFDTGWTLAGGNREATYTNLPAGHYRLRVLAFDTARPAEVSEVDLEVRKRPFFYETWWFFTLCVLALAGLVVSLYRFRVGQIRARFHAVSAERSRLARELHDTVIQGCTGVSALLEAVAITSPENGATREELLGLAREQVRSTINEARQVVWDVRHEQERGVEMVSALRTLAVQNGREAGASVEFTSELAELNVRASIAHEVLMTAREAILNALQHSGSPAVALALQLRGPEVVLSVADGGCGMVERNGDEHGHYGLIGMRERTERIGGKLKVESAPGAGTRVELTVGLARLNKSLTRS